MAAALGPIAATLRNILLPDMLGMGPGMAKDSFSGTAPFDPDSTLTHTNQHMIKRVGSEYDRKYGSEYRKY